MDELVEGSIRVMPTRYVRAAITIHWLSSALIISQFILGLKFADMAKGPARSELFLWHKTLGALLLLLAVGRLIVRLRNPPPPLPATLPTWQRIAAKWSHRLLYLLMFALPITGLSLAGAHAKDGMTMLLGGIPFPAINLGPVGEAHSLLAWGMIGLLGLHIAAALKHRLMDGPNVARRMSPFGAGTLGE